MRDTTTTIQQLKDLSAQFRDERGWGKHFTPKNLAISISLEAAELLEHYQWDHYRKEDKQAVAEELSDIIFTCMHFANELNIDISSTCMKKLEKIRKKYPTELFNPDQDNEAAYFRIKETYRKGQQND